MKKLRLKEVKKFVQSRTASKYHSAEWAKVYLVPKLCHSAFGTTADCWTLSFPQCYKSNKKMKYTYSKANVTLSSKNKNGIKLHM